MVGMVHSRIELTALGAKAAAKQASSAVASSGHRLATRSRKDCALLIVNDYGLKWLRKMVVDMIAYDLGLGCW